MVIPFLLKFKASCVAPGRTSIKSKLKAQYVYDERRSMLTVTEKGRQILAIESTSGEKLLTKKEDIERGEDRKNAWMW